MKKFLKILSVFILTVGILFAVAFAVLPLPGQVPILMYHFVGNAQDALESKNFVSKESFAKHMGWLERFGYRVISLDELYEIREGKREPRGRELAITFDDGNYTFGNIAYPILDQYDFPVTVFLVSESVKRRLHGSMTQKEVEVLLKNDWFDIGAHSKTHPFLSEMEVEKIRDEMIGSKKDFEKMFNRPINYFAYPYGDFDERVQKVAEEVGFRLAFTTSHKKLKGIAEGPYTLTRTKISRTSDNPFAFWLKISGIYDFFKAKRLSMKGAS